jgi:hypothetical protein
VDDRAADVDRRAMLRERVSDGIDGATNAGAETTRRSKKDSNFGSIFAANGSAAG